MKINRELNEEVTEMYEDEFINEEEFTKGNKIIDLINLAKTGDARALNRLKRKGGLYREVLDYLKRHNIEIKDDADKNEPENDDDVTTESRFMSKINQYKLMYESKKKDKVKKADSKKGGKTLKELLGLEADEKVEDKFKDADELVECLLKGVKNNKIEAKAKLAFLAKVKKGIYAKALTLLEKDSKGKKNKEEDTEE